MLVDWAQLAKQWIQNRGPNQPIAVPPQIAVIPPQPQQPPPPPMAIVAQPPPVYHTPVHVVQGPMATVHQIALGLAHGAAPPPPPAPPGAEDQKEEKIEKPEVGDSMEIDNSQGI